MAAWISPDVKSFGCVNTFFFLLKCIGFLFHLKKIACKWIMSTGWTGHLKGVLGSDTLRWFTIWGKQIGSDNTADRCSPLSGRKCLGEAGEWILQALLQILSFFDPTLCFFHEELKTEGMKILFLWLWKFLHSFYFLC